MKFLSLFKRKDKTQASTENGTDFTGVPLDDDITVETVHGVIHGGIHKTKPQQFSMGTTRAGGRMVKTMPKSLRKMKETSEKIDD